MALINFEEALGATTGTKRHLLLGNGFSISLFPDSFRYDSLLRSANFDGVPEARNAFDALSTTDFEVVIRSLVQSAVLGQVYNIPQALHQKMSGHAEALKELLVQAIAGRHPPRPSEIGEGNYRACRMFLAHFGGERRNARPDLRGNIYTLNYDLLLYWTLLHSQLVNWNAANPLSSTFEKTEEIRHDDGFRAPPEDYEAAYVTWDGEANHTQCVYYLHGALHLFDYGFDLQKICWERSGGLPLIDQIRHYLGDGKFPLFVSEGSSSSKLEKIRHSGYLHKALRSFSEICRSPSACLFVYGHSFDPSDDHILNQIGRGKIGRIFVSVFGNEATPANAALIARANGLKMLRSERYPLEVSFYQAESANVWG